jgi:hypothetical protein
VPLKHLLEKGLKKERIKKEEEIQVDSDDDDVSLKALVDRDFKKAKVKREAVPQSDSDDDVQFVSQRNAKADRERPGLPDGIRNQRNVRMSVFLYRMFKETDIDALQLKTER